MKKNYIKNSKVVHLIGRIIKKSEETETLRIWSGLRSGKNNASVRGSGVNDVN